MDKLLLVTLGLLVCQDSHALCGLYQLPKQLVMPPPVTTRVKAGHIVYPWAILHRPQGNYYYYVLSTCCYIVITLSWDTVM